MLSIFYISVDHLYVSVRDMSVQILCLFFKLGYLFFYWIVRVPYIFWKLIHYEIYGFHSVGCLFTLLILHCIEVFKFGVVSHDYLLLLPVLLASNPWNHCQYQCIPLCFLVSSGKYESKVQIFIYLLFWHVDSPFSHYHLLKRLFFPYYVSLAPLSKIGWLYTCEFISRLSILFHWSISLYRSTILF